MRRRTKRFAPYPIASSPYEVEILQEWMGEVLMMFYKRRKDLNLSVKGMAERLGIAEQTLETAWQKGKDVHMSTLWRWAKALDCDVEVRLKPHGKGWR